MTSAVIARRRVAWVLGAAALAAIFASAGARYSVQTVTTYQEQTYYQAEGWRSPRDKTIHRLPYRR